MSQLADMRKVFLRAHNTYHVPTYVCVELFIDACDACEWDTFNIDYDDPEWQIEEFQAALDYLFGESP